jgi:eukaryotic-like serine/threonine-protein kinase
VVVRLPSGLQLGDVVAGKYRLIREIGAGAMGVVVAAHHLNLDRTVAIKFLIGGALSGPDAVRRFVREARLAARIVSQHVVRVYDVAVLPDGIPYMELEYLEGCDVATRLRQVRRLPAPQTVDFVLQACEGISEAHALGIVHRDLKPANLFVTSRSGSTEVIKVLDFGISKAGDSVSSTLSSGASPLGVVRTASGPFGSPLYMSPEQMQSARNVDPRTDVWALGVILCELVTGEVPYRGESMVELYSMIRSGEPLRLRQRFPDLPGTLESIIVRCLQFDRELRFPDVKALATALLETGARPSAPPSVDETQVSASEVIVKSALPPRSTRAGQRTLALVLLVSAAVGAILLGSRVMAPHVRSDARAASSPAVECTPSATAGSPGACMAAAQVDSAAVEPVRAPASAPADVQRDPEVTAVVARAPTGLAASRKPPSPRPANPGAASALVSSGRDAAVANVQGATAGLTPRANVTTPSPSPVTTNPASVPPPMGMSSLESILEKRE